MTQEAPDPRGTAPLVAEEAAAERPLSRGTVLGHFMILDRLGAGGMGVVFSAFDYHLDRKVAIKLLKPGATGTAQSRLVREAKAMARLTDSHVRAVYEVGILEDRVFIAMELVNGSDLGHWLAQPRPVAAVLDVYLQAGRGLAAAHRVGLVHRDFKPENVLVDEEGRARVTDFGVAKLLADPVTGEGEPSPPEPTDLTAAGSHPGTPRYMAPEQRAGAAVDARADQYAFALALRESLAGRAPAWVRAALAPALDEDPGRRYPSMDELLARLARGPAWRRRGLAAAALLAAVVVALLLALRPAARPCRDAGARLAGVWDPAVRAAVEKAFLATGRSYARPVFDQVAFALDRAAGAWAAMHTDACEATALRGEQSAGLRDLRMECLDRRLQAIAALTDLFAHKADAALLDRALAGVLGLESLERCADAKALTDAYPPPEPALRARVEALRARMARMQALLVAQRLKDGTPLVEAASAEARTVLYPPLQAELFSLRASYQKETAPAAAEETFHQALAAAAAARDDQLVARDLVDLVYLLGVKLNRAAEARGLRPIAEAAIVRAGDRPALRATLLFTLAMVETAATHYDEAIRLHRQALALREQAFGPEHPDVARSLNGLGNVLLRTGPLSEARASYERAIAIWSKLFSSDHPFVGAVLTNLADVAEQEGDGEAALGYARRALVINETNLGPDHPNVASSLINMGDALEELGRVPEAVEAQRRALAIRTKAFGPESLEAAASMNIIAGTLRAAGRADEALAMAEHSLAIREQRLGPDHGDLAWTLETLAELHLDRREPAPALAAARRVVAIRAKVLGPEHPQTAAAEVEVAESLLMGGDAAGAATTAAAALALLEKAGRPTSPNRARFVLARALWTLDRERPRALTLAEAARREYEEDHRRLDAEKVAKWLATRR